MFDIKLIFILIFGICLAKLFDYDIRVTRSKKILYFLLPLGLFIIFLYDNYHHIFITPTAKEGIKLLTAFSFILSFYIYFSTKKNTYIHHVYDTSIYIIWAIIVLFCLIFIYDNEMIVKMGLLKLVLFSGLLISLIMLKEET